MKIIPLIITCTLLSGHALAKPITVPNPVTPIADFTNLVEKVSPAVVSVQVTAKSPLDNSAALDRFRGTPELEQLIPDFEEFMRRYRGQRPDQGRNGRSSGSGFFISASGHIVTNHHVIKNAEKTTVTLNDGTELKAQIIGSDEQTDLAVLKVKLDKPAPYVRFAKGGSVKIGEWVIAVGNPFNLGGTATVGIVSALGRQIGGAYADFIQIDAPINRGNSGGPTFNTNGEVVGVNTAIFSPTGGSVGIGFAIEADAASRIVSALIKTGEVTRGWLGVTIQSVTDKIAEANSLKSDNGAIVSEVVEASPAQKAGFRRGDIIVAVNGKSIKDSRDVTQKVGTMNAGSLGRFTIIRYGKTRNLSVKIGKRPSNSELISSVTPEESPSILGVKLAPIDKNNRKRLALNKRDKGILVTALEANSPLVEAGIKVGDALLEANGQIMSLPEDFRIAIKRAQKNNKKNLLIAVRKNNRTLFLPVSLK